MKTRIVRLLLVLVALACAGGAGFYAYRLEREAAVLRDTERAFTEDAIRLQATLGEIRAAQAGYLALGQDAAVWIQKVAQLRGQADAQLKRLAAIASQPDAESELATTGEAIAELGRFDGRIAGLLREEQTLTASGLIFSDSAQIVRAAVASLSKARAAQAASLASSLSTTRRRESYAAGAAGGVLLLVLALLALAPGARRAPEDEQEPRAISSSPSLFAPVPAVDSFDDEPDTRFERTPWRLDEAAAGPGGAVAPGEDDARQASSAAAGEPSPRAQRGGDVPAGPGEAVPMPLPAGAPPNLDLSGAAQLCTDFARVRDASEMPALLARAAELLDASGIVVWVGTDRSDVLWPAFSHGYSPQALSKMRAIPRDGATPVSAAFRKGMMEVVPAGDGTSGAIVSPILASNGCVGVMAVEIRHGAETSEAEQALASILAAQLATLVAGDSA